MSNIADNLQYKQLLEQLQGIGCLASCFPFLFTKEQRKEIKRLRTEVEEMRRLPDQFNTLFLERGWVCYDTINADLLKRCVTLCMSGDIEGAEQELINYYRNDDIRYLVFPLANVPGFKERYVLLNKALEDYREGRYHACIPVFLMIIDVLSVINADETVLCLYND